MPAVKDSAGLSEFLHLYIVFIPTDTALVIDEGLLYKGSLQPGLPQANTQVRVFPWVYPAEASSKGKSLSGKPHIEATWLELAHMVLIPPYTSSGEQGGHRVVDRLLKIGEVLRGRIWSTEAIYIVTGKKVIRRLQVMRRQQAIGIQDDKVISRSPLHTIVTRIPRSGVLLLQIDYVSPIGKGLHHLF